jgi:hypothetical protein
MTTHRRVCTLCGTLFIIMLPPGAQETERDKLCGICAVLPPRPDPARDRERSPDGD